MENNNDFGKIASRPRSRKLRPKIDLAAMVSVSFLLIIFFMVTKELSKPKAMDLGLPSGGCGPDICCRPDFNRIITVLLDDNDKIITYRGLMEVPEDSPKTFNYGKNGIRRDLIEKNKKIKEYFLQNERPNRGAIVIIKPSKNSNYGNLVDILDEMSITNIGTYSIIDYITPEEEKLLASN